MKTIRSGVIVAGQVQPVQVEVVLHTRSFPQFTITGLPQGAVRESRERVLSALKSSGVRLPRGRTVVNLLPADLPKSGTTLDLAIVLGVLQEIGLVPSQPIVAVGQLGLDGSLLPAPGTLRIVDFYQHSFPDLPAVLSSHYRTGPNWQQVRAMSDVRSLIAVLQTPCDPKFLSSVETAWQETELPTQFPEMHSTSSLVRMAELLLAGGHHAFLYGPAGEGKTSFRQLLSVLGSAMLTGDRGWLRAMMVDQCQIQSGELIEMLLPESTLSTCYRCRQTRQESDWGVVWRSQGGVCFVDNCHHLQATVRAALLASLEASRAATAPHQATFVLTANPCYCGQFGTPDCGCSPAELERFRLKFDTALLDRCALQRRFGHEELRVFPREELLESWERIRRAVKRQLERYTSCAYTQNAQLDWSDVRDWPVPKEVRQLTENWSYRRQVFIRQLAQTLADLEQADIQDDHYWQSLEWVRPAFTASLRNGASH